MGLKNYSTTETKGIEVNQVRKHYLDPCSKKKKKKKRLSKDILGKVEKFCVLGIIANFLRCDNSTVLTWHHVLILRRYTLKTSGKVEMHAWRMDV